MENSPIKIEYNYHNHVDLAEILSLLNIIKLQNHKILMTQQELAQQLDALTTQTTKIKAEVQALLDAIANAGNVSPEVQTAVDNLKAAIQGVDDLNPDAQP